MVTLDASLSNHRKGKGCPTIALIGSIGGRVAAGALFMLRGPTGVVPRGMIVCSSKQGVTRVRRQMTQRGMARMD